MLFFLFAWTEIKFVCVGRYIPDATGAVYDVLRDMAQSHASKKKRYDDDEDAELLRKVSARLITKETLREKLAQHVEQVSSQLVWNWGFWRPIQWWVLEWPFHLYLQVDYEMALEYATQSGVSEEPREAMYIQSLEAENKFIDLRSPIFVFRLLQ
jgi:DNA topoisomerase-6 subunit B